jgi:hypothetical protein
VLTTCEFAADYGFRRRRPGLRISVSAALH